MTRIHFACITGNHLTPTYSSARLHTVLHSLSVYISSTFLSFLPLTYYYTPLHFGLDPPTTKADPAIYACIYMERRRYLLYGVSSYFLCFIFVWSFILDLHISTVGIYGRFVLYSYGCFNVCYSLSRGSYLHVAS